jgi:hypothetical protein
MFDHYLFKNIRYYASYQLLFVIIFIILSSSGAFFHFLLNHEISIVESWLHNNHWEILIISKLLSLTIMNRWFRVRLYEMKTIKQLSKELLKWPEHRAVVISFFIMISYLALTQNEFAIQNLGYWYYYLTSFIGLFLFFGIEFVVIAYLDDVLNQDERVSRFWLGLLYTIFFAIGFRLCVPDYYNLLTYVVFCFTALLLLSGESFKNWSNVVCFLFVFVAPMGSFFGLDPVWGDDFSPFSIKSKLAIPFLAVIWMVSFSYYKYRDQILSGARKFVR